MMMLLDMQNQLAKIIEDFPCPYLYYAKQIGITEHTLLSFLGNKREPRRMTRWKIEQFITRYNKRSKR